MLDDALSDMAATQIIIPLIRAAGGQSRSQCYDIWKEFQPLRGSDMKMFEAYRTHDSGDALLKLSH